MNNKTLQWSLSVALAGFLFGFDTVVISGANLPIRELWDTTPFFHGTFIMSMALWGTVLGALGGSWPTDRLGRKKTLFWIGVLYFVSALGSALATGPYVFSFFRFIGGVGVGASSVAAPTYIAEITSSNNRGKLVALYQFMIVFGILIAYISNFLLEGFGGINDWRYMLGVEGIPAFIYCLFVLGVSNSPRWLYLHRHDREGALRILRQIDPSTAESRLQDMREDLERDADAPAFFSNRFTKPIVLAFLLAFFNQLSGINFILYYAPELLELAGLAPKDSLFNAISIGGINLVFTLLGLALIDRMGRKALMYVGSIGYITSLALTAFAFYYRLSPDLLLAFILLFIASHAIGQGAVIWVFISEIFPNKVRARGQSLGCGTHWVFAALITLLTPVFIDRQEGVFGQNPWPVFAFFAFMMVLQLLYVHFLMPETKGKTLEELSKEIHA
ncbi:sugar porter family MFS transporter [Roseivirga sp. BDSF3-8]|uniref:sugar porter family MFS transporter n=1 Tax=Roseivirga sp. BDSF3-8 TaxID=3241598 RepID=UPI003531A284